MFVAFSGPRATALQLTTAPGGAVTGAALSPQPAGRLADPNGAPAVGCAGVVIQATVVGGGATLANATATVQANGTFTFAGLAVTGVGTHTLRFTALQTGLAPLDAQVGITSALVGLFPNAPTIGNWQYINDGSGWQAAAQVGVSTGATHPDKVYRTGGSGYAFVDVGGMPFTKAHRFIWPAGTNSCPGIFPYTLNGAVSRLSTINRPDSVRLNEGAVYLGILVRHGGTPRWSKGSRADIPGTGPRSGGVKWGYITGPYRSPPQDSNWYTSGILAAGSQEVEGGTPSFLTQFDGDVGAAAGGSAQYNQCTTNVLDGAWHTLEWILTPNTFTGDVPNADGRVQTFVDGVQETDIATAIIYPHPTAARLENVQVFPIYGVSLAPWDVWVDIGPVKCMVLAQSGVGFPNAPSGAGWTTVWDGEWNLPPVVNAWTPTTPAAAPHYGEAWYLPDNGSGLSGDVYNNIQRAYPTSYDAGTRTLTFSGTPFRYDDPNTFIGENPTMTLAGNRIEINSPTGWQWFTIQSNTDNTLTLVETPGYDPVAAPGPYQMRRHWHTVMAGSTTTVLNVQNRFFRERQSVNTSPYRTYVGRTIKINDGSTTEGTWHTRTVVANTMATITLDTPLGFNPSGKLWHDHFELDEVQQLVDVPAAPWRTDNGTGKALALRTVTGHPGGGLNTRVRQRADALPGASAARVGPLAWPVNLAAFDELYLAFWIRYRGDGVNPFRLYGGPLWPGTPDEGRCIAIKTIYAESVDQATTPDDETAHIPWIPFGVETSANGITGTQFRTTASNNPSPYLPSTSRNYPGNPGEQSGWQSWMPSRRQAGINVIDGNWHQVEVYIKGNTQLAGVGTIDGIIRQWVDAVLETDGNIIWHAAGGTIGRRVNSLKLEPIYGGAQIGVPHDMWMDYGRMKVMVR